MRNTCTRQPLFILFLMHLDIPAIDDREGGGYKFDLDEFWADMR